MQPRIDSAMRISGVHLIAARLMAFAVVIVALTSHAWADARARNDISFDVFVEQGARTIDDVCCGAANFDDQIVDAVRVGVDDGAVWIKLPPLRPGAVLEIMRVVDSATLYEKSSDGWLVSRVGDSVEPEGSALPVPRMAFALTGSAGPQAERYLRIVQTSLVVLTIREWDSEEFRSDVERRQIIEMLLLGFVAAIIAYNLVVSVLTRDVVFALNALTVGSLVVLDLYLTGLGAFYVWPKAASNAVLIASLTGTAIFSALFFGQMLFHDAFHKSTRPIHAIAGISVIVCLASALIPFWVVVVALAASLFVLLAVVLTIAVRQAHSGNRNAYLLLFPLLMVMLPGGALVALNAFTDISFGAIEPFLLEVVLAIEALAFSLSLAARIRSQRMAVVAAQAKLAQSEYESAKRFAELQERERARIASDLHDSIGHNLVMILGLIEPGAKKSTPQKNLSSAAGLMRRTIQMVRQLSHELHPSTLSDLGWNAAIESLFSNLERAHGISVTIEQEGGEPALSEEAKLHLYRVVQELVSNIAKHSGATHCDARFQNDENSLEIRISDNGVGLADKTELQHGLGLTSIAARLKSINGSWKMDFDRDEGFETLIQVPIPKDANGPRPKQKNSPDI